MIFVRSVVSAATGVTAFKGSLLLIAAHPADFSIPLRSSVPCTSPDSPLVRIANAYPFFTHYSHVTFQTTVAT